ncbi:MAG: fibrillarin-like rRNA/tRNA 2'-O-methyltransferase [Candidatus Micrarchaeaceae archaeon]
MSVLFDGVFKIGDKLATASIAKSTKVYGEELIEYKGTEYRSWNPYRSKLAAAILKGIKRLEIAKGSKVLYLGAATGTTVSHISDIVGREGIVYAVEISERSMRDLLKVCESRENIIPILNDARNIAAYSGDVGKVDVIYQDIAAPDQADILIKNAQLLRRGGFAYVAVKSQSIDISKQPKQVFSEFIKKVSGTFNVIESTELEPFDSMHLFLVLEKT